MPVLLADRLRARGAVPPDYAGRGLLSVPATVLAAFGARTADDPPPLAQLDPALLDGVRQIVVVLADGLGWRQTAVERLGEEADQVRHFTGRGRGEQLSAFIDPAIERLRIVDDLLRDADGLATAEAAARAGFLLSSRRRRRS